VSLRPQNDGVVAKANLGTLILIGGREDKLGHRLVLKEVAQNVGSGKLVIATVASEVPDLQWTTYATIFQEMGIPEIVHFHVDTREQASDPARTALFDDASAVFFTGGDQLKITSKLAGTPAYSRIRAIYEEHAGLIAGTSAGASAMGEMMLVSHGTDESHKVAGAFFMARGLGFVREMVIDQHFAQRARIERLVGAVAEDPTALGVGIDEDTAIVLGPAGPFRVIGGGAVYVADGQTITYTNLSERNPETTLCLFDIRLHVLCHETCFDLRSRRPLPVGIS
jgi:cyanophycinase